MMKPQRGNEMETTAFIDTLKSTDLGRRLIAEQQAEHLQSRRAIAAELESLADERKRELPDLEARANKAKAEAGKTRAAYETAETEQLRAAGLLNNARASYKARLDRLHNRLRATAPAAIDRFCERLHREADELRADGVKTGAAKTNLFDTGTGRIVKNVFSDAPSKARRLAAMRDAMKAAEGLALQVLEPAELDARLADLYDSLPAVKAEKMEGAA
jgi:DNA repair exonuclease SbcCD ATPase subunit